MAAVQRPELFKRVILHHAPIIGYFKGRAFGMLELRTFPQGGIESTGRSDQRRRSPVILRPPSSFPMTRKRQGRLDAAPVA